MSKGDRIRARNSGIEGTIITKLFMISYYRVLLDNGTMTYMHISDMERISEQ